MSNPNDSMDQYIDPHFSKLAEELAYNYFACSFGNKRGEISAGQRKKISTLLAGRKTKEAAGKIHRTRNILVVGAGASIDSYAGLPGGGLLIDRIDHKYKNYFEGPLRTRYEQDKKEIEAITGKPLNFENYLYILSKSYITQPEIRKEISEMTDLRYAPVYFNEIIAHMLKHSFLDAVINFNFEETLDQAIFEEIGEGNYYNVISDGHCIDLDTITSDGTLKVPIYVKPHGTNSHKSTLRFTNKHYFDIPDDISTMLKCIIGGFESSNDIIKINEKEKETRIKVEKYRAGYAKSRKNRSINKVNLIVVGFNMESVEFLDILNNYLPSESEIYYINFCKPSQQLEREVYHSKLGEFFLSKHRVLWQQYCNPPSVEPAEKEKEAREKRMANAIEKNYKASFRFLGTNPNPNNHESFLANYESALLKSCGSASAFSWENSLPPLGRFVHYLFSEVWKSFYKQYIPQHIHRHKLVNLLFFDPALRKPGNNTKSDLDHHVELQNKTRGNFEKEYKGKDKEPRYNYHYFLDRTIVEIAIAFLRGHGAVDYFELKHGRVNMYYKLYRETIEKYNANLKGRQRRQPVYALAQLVLGFTDNTTEIRSNIICIECDPVFDSTVSSQKAAAIAHNNKFIKDIITELNALVNNRGIYNRDHGDNSYNRHRRKLTAAILYKLFRHKCTSPNFIKRIKQHSAYKDAFMGLQRVELPGKHHSKRNYKEYRYAVMTHLQMLVTSANYLLGNNFYSIATYHLRCELYIWQSFKLEHQLHTNLKLDYEIDSALREINNRPRNADSKFVLSVSEVGGNLIRYLQSDQPLDANYVQICSYEAVRQLHPRKKEEKEEKYIARLILDHRKYMLGINDKPLDKAAEDKLSKLTLLLIPFTLHNHHMTLFAQYNNNEKTLVCSSAVYIWRRGFSTQMNPMIMNPKDGGEEHKKFVRNDLKALYAIFIKYFSRGLIFLHRHIKDKDYNSILPPGKTLSNLDPYNAEDINKITNHFKKMIEDIKLI